ncbi:ABC transporter permease [Chitinophaga pendula]|uniref:ABC transporter permease n=1 Tax=Chitinophaga TaxID=79328 RepID=UPI000BAF3E0A|nr:MULTISPECIES: ABC transporter permease [Chitinophaga]ASZ11913.1 ABC transporter permease [Chitinophaga sp. MD30]UCJ05059.1 ABC transporter permease [Chitinophaga pendula]
MLKNYFKIAIAVLQRRKFFTFLSLFVISFTLMLLTVLASFVNKMFNDNYPDRKRDRSLYINAVTMTGPESMNRSMLSKSLVDDYINKLKTPVSVAISTWASSTNTYLNNKKISLQYKYTNAAYWDVLDYDFTEGKPFSRQQLDNAERVAVISEHLKQEYFGGGEVVGKFITADDIQYRVIGVVKDVAASSQMFFSDMYLPYTVSKKDYRKESGYFGSFRVILLAGRVADVAKMRQEYEHMASKLPITQSGYDKIESKAQDYLHAFLDFGRLGTAGNVYLAIAIFVCLVMFLPAINLVNINITRIMERSSEIGVRKSFGATSWTLTGQFIIENLILTLGGGLLSIPLSLAALALFNYLSLIDHFHLSLNVPVLLLSLLACIVFGLLSGVYPAWRMSRMHVIVALRTAS